MKYLGRYLRLRETKLQENEGCYIMVRTTRLKSRRRWAGHVARMEQSINAYRGAVGKPEGKRHLGRLIRRLEYIKMDLRRWGVILEI